MFFSPKSISTPLLLLSRFWAGMVVRNSREFANDLRSQRSHRTSQWASAAGDSFDTCSPATWLPLPALPDPCSYSQVRTSSQSSVIRAFAPVFANPMFANLPTKLLGVRSSSVAGGLVNIESETFVNAPYCGKSLYTLTRPLTAPTSSDPYK